MKTFLQLCSRLIHVDPKRLLRLEQIIVLLRAIEDLQTVNTRILSQCSELLVTALGREDTRSRNGTSDSLSHLSASSVPSFAGKSLLSVKGSRAESERERGWDWRTEKPPSAASLDIVSMLREGLARDVARAWVEGEVE